MFQIEGAQLLTICDKLLAAEIKLGKAKQLQGDSVESFFSYPDSHYPQLEETQMAICCDYQKYATYSEIVFDYLWEALKALTEAKAIADAVHSRQREEGAI